MKMKKFIFTFVAAVVAAFSINAQTLEPSKFIDNTYIRITGGATALTHPGCLGYEDWGHSIQGVIGAEIGKWITPKFGVAFEGDFGLRNGSKHGIFQYMGYETKSNAFNYITVAGLAKFNLSNIFGGFKPRKVEFVLATGPMWVHGYPSNIKNGHGNHYYINDMGVKFKGEINVNVTNRLQVNILPEFNYNLTGGFNVKRGNFPYFDSRNSWYGLQVGVTYKIGKEFTLCDKRYTQEEYDALMAEVNRLHNQEPTVINNTTIVEKNVKVIDNNIVVMFDKGCAELTDIAKSTLNMIDKGTKVKILAGASPEGSKNFNQKLSEDRANTVKNFLEKNGVEVVETSAVGAELGSRVAIVTIK